MNMSGVRDWLRLERMQINLKSHVYYMSGLDGSWGHM